jgi:hypothetical protein
VEIRETLCKLNKISLIFRRKLIVVIAGEKGKLKEPIYHNSQQSTSGVENKN